MPAVARSLAPWVPSSTPAVSLAIVKRALLDVGICEATFRAGTDVARSGRDVHMTARRAGEMSHEAGVGQLVITHLLPGADRDGARLEAEAAYGAPVQVATSGLTIET